MVKVINVTVSGRSICPVGNFENILINEKFVNMLLNCGKNHVKIKNPMVITPAIIWFAVMLDAKIPKEIYPIANNKNPSNVTRAVVICGVPK